jgi:molybdopterin-containing oxidoreductase family iron-sulfur binding subunit
MKLDVLGEEPPDGSDAMDGLDRRELLKLLGGTLALAGAGCSCQPPEHLLAYHRSPDAMTVGNPLHYATCITLAGIGTPLLVTAREGRPVKIEGNPEHPLTGGASGPLEQAEIHRLYDPQRATALKRDGKPSTRAAFLEAASELVRTLSRKDGGRGVRFLSEPTSSPFLTGLKARILEQLPNARFVTWTPLSAQHRYDGAKLAFGRAFEPLYDFSRAKVVAAFDDDFLFPQGARLGQARGWAERRSPGPEMSRLYVIEPSLTITGTMADHRQRVKGSEVELLMRALVVAVAKMRTALSPLAAGALKLEGEQEKWVLALAKDLVAAGPKALVTVGDRQPPVVHALAHALCSELGALGHTVTLVNPPLAEPNSGPQALKALGDELALGQVDALVITAPNPAYSTYGNVDLAGLLKHTRSVIYLGAYEDETAAVSQWFVPRTHALETWGDARALDGSALLQQPLIEPLYPDSMSEAQLYAALVGDRDPKPLELLRASWARRRGINPDEPEKAAALHLSFDKWVQAGVVPSSAYPVESAAIDLNAIAQVAPSRPQPGIELNFARDYKVHDGRFANCPWLQELPDPVTKLVWDNAALMSQKTAAKLGLSSRLFGEAGSARESQQVKLTVTGRGLNASLVVPVLVLPGHADDCITLPLGYGRSSTGEQVADGVGVNAYVLRHSDAPYFSPVEVTKADGTHLLVTTQEHWKMEGKELALEARLEELSGLKAKLEHLNGTPPTLQQPVDGSKVEHRWGMAIDLSRCTGCSACVTACQAENNIPVVGKSSVAKNREMFWIRVDRYFSEGDEPSVISQPVTCQQCEAAPCEPVCPVGATSHSEEGLNDMVYNRCIGSRACGNSCPYQVRRFNYLSYHREQQPIERLLMNPEVTVRARGVMEKCTFCIQRIERARIESRREGRKLAEGAVRTACQQACPTSAIAFGSLNDPSSEVSKQHRDARRYELLHGLGTRPRNVYLLRIKNPNPELS